MAASKKGRERHQVPQVMPLHWGHSLLGSPGKGGQSHSVHYPYQHPCVWVGLSEDAIDFWDTGGCQQAETTVLHETRKANSEGQV